MGDTLRDWYVRSEDESHWVSDQWMNEVPHPYRNWHEYLRGQAFIPSKNEALNQHFKQIYEAVSAQLYERRNPGDEDTRVLVYRNPEHIISQYGRFQFRVFCLRTGRRPQVRFHEFDRFGLNKDDGTCSLCDSYPWDRYRAAIEKKKDECQSEFSAKLRAAYDQWEPYRAKLVIAYSSNRDRYYEYLQSAQWARIRAAVVERDEHACMVCNSTRSLNVHHRTYDRIGREEMRDLVTLCRACHERYHHESARAMRGRT